MQKTISLPEHARQKLKEFHPKYIQMKKEYINFTGLTVAVIEAGIESLKKETKK